MTMLIKFIVCFIAGIGAGLGTGFAGMSAAAVISPMLITFLDMPAYEAVGIALASDVLASAVSAYTYGKNKNLDIRNGVVMMVSVLCFTMVGSWIASQVPNSTMGSFSVFMTFLLGVKFIVKPVMTTKNAMEAVDPKKRFVQSVICGVMIGFICGFIGAAPQRIRRMEPPKVSCISPKNFFLRSRPTYEPALQSTLPTLKSCSPWGFAWMAFIILLWTVSSIRGTLTKTEGLNSFIFFSTYLNPSQKVTFAPQ